MTGTNVYTVLEALGLGVSGGRIHGVGVGGYLLGGGYSHFTDKVSLVIISRDNHTLIWPGDRVACRWTT